MASIGVFEDEGVLEHARMLERDVLGPGLRDLAERHPSIGEVRGLGVFWAIELVRDRQTREPFVPVGATGEAAAPMARVVAACRERGLMPFVAGHRLHVVPPVNTPVDEVRQGLAWLDEALAVADEAVGAAPVA